MYAPGKARRQRFAAFPQARQLRMGRGRQRTVDPTARHELDQGRRGVGVVTRARRGRGARSFVDHRPSRFARSSAKPAPSNRACEVEEPPMETDVRANDTLANERTFLAYVRTALAFIAFGFVIARFSLFAREFSALVHGNGSTGGVSTAFGTGMAIFGMAVAVLGAWRYAVTDRGLREGRVVRLSVVSAYSSRGHRA